MSILGLSIVLIALAAIACSFAYIRHADKCDAGELRTAYEWEAITGTQVLDYAEWRREHIAIDERITRAEFDRLATLSASRHRKTLP